jgi:hypothetical protein
MKPADSSWSSEIVADRQAVEALWGDGEHDPSTNMLSPGSLFKMHKQPG